MVYLQFTIRLLDIFILTQKRESVKKEFYISPFLYIYNVANKYNNKVFLVT